MGKIGRVRTAFASMTSAVLLVACSAFPPKERGLSTRSVRAGEIFTLEQGRWVWLGDTNYLLSLVAVREDSRCPREASCVWEGNARVAFTLREAVPGKNRGELYEVVDTELDLNTSGRFEQRFEFLHGFIRLHEINPQPPIDDPKRYVATVSFECKE